jgi:hypothetical protein
MPLSVALAASALVLPRAGTQFITGVCASDADCATSCCGFKSGKCAAAVVAQERDGGCGFGDVAPNNIATIALGSQVKAAGVDNSKAGQRAAGGAAAPAAGAAAPAAPAAGSGKAAGTQFITGECANDGECASTCCSVGKCAARLVATGPGGKGCGFGGGAAAAPAAPAPPAAPAAPTAPAAPAVPVSQDAKKVVFTECASDSECQQGCCGFTSGKCAGPAVAQTNGSGGCGRGGAAPNCNVASALGFQICVAGGSADKKAAGVNEAAAFSARLNNIPFTPSK